MERQKRLTRDSLTEFCNEAESWSGSENNAETATYILRGDQASAAPLAAPLAALCSANVTEPEPAKPQWTGPQNVQIAQTRSRKLGRNPKDACGQEAASVTYRLLCGGCVVISCYLVGCCECHNFYSGYVRLLINLQVSLVSTICAFHKHQLMCDVKRPQPKPKLMPTLDQAIYKAKSKCP